MVVILPMLYIIILCFVHFHNYLLDRIIVLFLRRKIPTYSLTQGWRCVTVSLTGEAVKTYFCRAHLLSNILCILFALFFTRGSNHYFAYSTKILYSKIKLTNGHRGLGEKWSFDLGKKTLISSCCCCIWMHPISTQFSTSVESSVVSVTKTSRNITMLTHPLC